jgi:hypothetical protein
VTARFAQASGIVDALAAMAICGGLVVESAAAKSGRRRRVGGYRFGLLW